MEQNLEDVPEQYKHLFENDKPVRRPTKRNTQATSLPDLMSYFNFNKMHSVRLLTTLHGVIQGVIIAAAGIHLWMWIDGTVAARRSVITVAACLLISVTVRLVFELAVVLFRIYEEMHLTRLGIDEFNTKIRARAE